MKLSSVFFGKSFLLMYLVASMLLGLAIVRVSASSSTVTFRVEPYNKTPGVAPGDMVMFDVYIDSPPGSAIIGWAMNIRVDPAVLMPGYFVDMPSPIPDYWLIAASSAEGYFLYDWCNSTGWDPDPGASPTLWDEGVRDPENGTITATVETVKRWIYLTPGVGANGTGNLVTFYFTSLNETAYSPVEIFDAYYYTSWASPDLDKRPADVVVSGHYNMPPTGVRTKHPVDWDHDNVTDFYVETESNSTVSNFAFDETYMVDIWMGEISFNVTGPTGTTGFCNVTIPQGLMTGTSWLVLVDNVSITYTLSENATHTFLYFNYTHSTHKVQIYGTWVIPEFSAPKLLMTLLIVALAITILAKRTWSNKRRHPSRNRRHPSLPYYAT